MAELPVPADLDALLAQADWLRALAHHLVRRSALRSPPDRGRPLRPWLAQVLRNATRMHVRGEARRRSRDASAASTADALPAPDVLMERMQMQRTVAELVMALEEPFRFTLLLHFYEGLTCNEIARRSGTPGGTVRWRLKEALDRLRARLDERHGSRDAWRAALLPLGATDRQRGAAVEVGGSAGKVSAWAWTLGLVALAAGTGTVWWQARARQLPPATATRDEGARAAAAPPTPGATDDGASRFSAGPGSGRRSGKAMAGLMALASAREAAARLAPREEAIEACLERRQRVLACKESFAAALVAAYVERNARVVRVEVESLRRRTLMEMQRDGEGPLEPRRRVAPRRWTPACNRRKDSWPTSAPASRSRTAPRGSRAQLPSWTL
jgi:RNA polymerase sigma factor (sigma-70 family)